MRAGKRTLILVAIAAVTYVVYPYVTLARLGAAMGRGDTKTLEALVDWSQVREGIKEDICDNVADTPAPATAATNSGLRPFGFSFVRGIASNVIDAHVSPHGILAVARQYDPATLSLDALSGVKWAFFDSPTTFMAELDPPGGPAGAAPMRVQLELRDGAWKVTRVWLPPKMLMAANDPS